LSTVIAIAWFAVPVYVLAQALVGLWRRWWLLLKPEQVEAQVIEVKASHVTRLEEATVVDLEVTYSIEGCDYQYALTRTDHQRRQYGVGSVVELICEQGRPGNVIDVERRRWDDVIGPFVFGLLLLLFMAWAGPFLVGLTRTTGLF
jgi:hypothetical protein